MRLLRARVLTIGVAGAAAAFSVAGCGAGDAARSAKDAVDPVAQAAQVTSSQDGGIAMTMKATMSVGGHDIAMDGNGVMSRDGKRGTMETTSSVAGQTLKMSEIVDHGVVYVRSPQLSSTVPGGKTWMKLDLNSELAKQGIDLSSLTGAGTQDPAAVLVYLKGAGPSSKVGTETINGVDTTHYHVDADLRKAASKGGAAAEKSVEALIKQAGISHIPVDVWVDDQHLVRREAMKYEATVQGQTSAMDMTIDFTKFGVAVDVKAPPASDTSDIGDLLSKAG